MRKIQFLNEEITLDCDVPTDTYPSIYRDIDGRYFCRCIVCAECGKHTGNSNQGHFSAWCSVTRDMRDHHFCCPDACELTGVN